MQVNRRSLAVTALIVFLTVVLWYQFVYSPMESDASNAKNATQSAEQDAARYEKQLAATNTNAKAAEDHKVALTELQSAIPQNPGITDLLRATDQIRVATGVTFQSIVPSPPTAQSAPGTISLTIGVQGTYQQVMSYLDQLMQMRRLVVVDNVAVSVASSAGGSTAAGTGPAGEVFAGQGAAPMLQIQITARAFTQASLAPPGSKGASATQGSSGSGGASSGSAAGSGK